MDRWCLRARDRAARRKLARPMVCEMSSWTRGKVLHKVLRAVALRNTAQGRVNLAVLLVHSCPLEPKKVVKGCGGLLEGREL